MPASPHACVFESGDSPRTFLPGDTLELDLLLLGRVAELQAFAVLATFDFRLLVSKMLRRTLELAHDYAPGQTLDWDLEPWLEKAAAVRVVSSDLVWHDWQRYSNRQRTKMRLGGLVGEMTLEGDLRPFSALLRTAEIVHVGKGTTFGLGRVEVQPA